MPRLSTAREKPLRVRFRGFLEFAQVLKQILYQFSRLSLTTQPRFLHLIKSLLSFPKKFFLVSLLCILVSSHLSCFEYLVQSVHGCSGSLYLLLGDYCVWHPNERRWFVRKIFAVQTSNKPAKVCSVRLGVDTKLMLSMRARLWRYFVSGIIFVCNFV